jgi:hypothetical protein
VKTSLAPQVLLSLLTAACATTQSRPVDPVTDPTVVGAVDAAVQEAAAESVAAKDSTPGTVGRRVGMTVGVLAAIFGGGSSEPIEASIGRYRRFRDAGEAAGSAMAVSKAAARGWNRGFAFDLQMAELVKIDGIDVTRPAPDEIDIRFPSPEPALLATVACAIGSDTVDIEGPRGTAFDVREALIERGMRPETLNSFRNDELTNVVLRVRPVK